MVALWELILLYITQPKAATFLSSTEFHLTAYKSAPRCFLNGRIMQTTAKQEAKHWSVLGGNCTAWGRLKLSYVRNVAGWVTERQQGNNLGVIRQSGGSWDWLRGTDLGARRGTDVPLAVHCLGLQGFAVFGDLLRFNDAFRSSHLKFTNCSGGDIRWHITKNGKSLDVFIWRMLIDEWIIPTGKRFGDAYVFKVGIWKKKIGY